MFTGVYYYLLALGGEGGGDSVDDAAGAGTHEEDVLKIVQSVLHFVTCFLLLFVALCFSTALPEKKCRSALLTVRKMRISIGNADTIGFTPCRKEKI